MNRLAESGGTTMLRTLLRGGFAVAVGILGPVIIMAFGSKDWAEIVSCCFLVGYSRLPRRLVPHRRTPQ